MKLPQVEPFVAHCICHGAILLALKGLYLALSLIATPHACEWAVLTVLAWYIVDNMSLRCCRQDAEAGLHRLIAQCDASLASISDLAVRYESIDKRCQAANFRHLRARDATLRELNWTAFCRRCILLEHLRVFRGESRGDATVRRFASDGDINCGGRPLPRTHSFTT
jgi:hypothetical protein